MKKIIITVSILVAVYFLYEYFFNASAGQSNDPAQVFPKLAEQYGTEYTRNIEKLFRYETGHFKSRQFLAGYSPGMVATKNNFPFGWASLQEFVQANPKYKDGYSLKSFDTDAGQKSYVGFPSLEASANFVAWFLKTKRGGNVGLWNSTDPGEASAYLANLQRVTAKYV